MMDAETMIDLLIAAGREPFGYSGRGMFGRRCVAVRLDSWTELFRIGGDLARAGGGITTARLPTPSAETLGLEVVAYWEGLRWPG